jgi:hypothetical protein
MSTRSSGRVGAGKHARTLGRAHEDALVLARMHAADMDAMWCGGGGGHSGGGCDSNVV